MHATHTAKRPDLILMCFAVSEQLVKQAADLLISTGLQKAGYEYLVVDGMLSLSALLSCSGLGVAVRSTAFL